ncbi:diacylglycerol/lipid kinase family protein [Acidomonas methanolica]|uniref:Diacylglycerol/sphingosine kinase n=2 Tax=Acidomonas methanolica TaxID=437 RepID=A0A023D2P5_ACIMT|nr:diacylglycerol kinase family protein [Acidomonas methanolica]MBU2654149.1 diacylglycerol kinase [Acidomonas methanolica]TCS30622.1 YegS/Rv2252/BmrU family lipid kinase [Acidomonas methanolica]GAJ28334.1 diacylglycerol/sphingosine kinase [Acidomonas methanolica NBRC 104435]GBQ45966.1 sphingosine kinase [Acidomonas methanolica]GEK98818.1 hypothetical protein AME01nite_13170 [Acidomonas methanolica NBRC 104435]
MRVLVIFNPTAGRRRLHRLRRFVRGLQEQAVPVSVAATAHAGHGRLMAQDAGEAATFTHIVAAGGDGTIAEVADGLAGLPVTMGILPLGTANVLAHELGLSFVPEQNARDLAAGCHATIWPGRLTVGGETRLFLQMVGVGFDAQVVHGLSLPVKRWLGKGAYVLQTIAELRRYDFPPLLVTLDGREERAFAVVISNGRYYGGRFVMAPEATPFQKGFSVSLLDRAGPGGVAAVSLGLALGEPARGGVVRRLAAQEVEVRAAAPVPVQHDGEASGRTPLSVSAVRQPLRVAVPPDGAAVSSSARSASGSDISRA